MGSGFWGVHQSFYEYCDKCRDGLKKAMLHSKCCKDKTADSEFVYKKYGRQ